MVRLSDDYSSSYTPPQPSVVQINPPSLPKPYVPYTPPSSPWQQVRQIQSAPPAPRPAPKPIVYNPPPLPKPYVPYKPPTTPYQQMQQIQTAPPPTILKTNPQAGLNTLNGLTGLQPKPVQPTIPNMPLPRFTLPTNTNNNSNQITWTHGSIPQAVADLLGKGLSNAFSLKDGALIPKFQNGQASPATDPTLLASKVLQNTGNNPDWNKTAKDALYLLSGLAGMGNHAPNVNDGSESSSGLKAGGIQQLLPQADQSSATPTGNGDSTVGINGLMNQLANYKPDTQTQPQPQAQPQTQDPAPGTMPSGNTPVNTGDGGNYNVGANQNPGTGGGLNNGGGFGGLTSGGDGSISLGGNNFSIGQMLQMGLSPDEIAALHQVADAQAKAQNDVQRQALTQQQTQADSNWNGDQQAINNQLLDNSQQLDQSSFQDYLKSRQAIADRGLASSGLSDAANTQLLLAKQQAMAGIQRQTNQQLGDSRRVHDNALSDINGKRSLINDSQTSSDIYQKLFQSATDTKQKNNQMLMDWMKWNTPSGDTLAKNQNSLQVANIDNGTKMQIAQLNNQTKLTIDENNNATDLAKNANAIDMQKQTLNSQNWNNSQKQMIDIANQSYDQAKSLLSALSKDPKNTDLQNQYATAIASANSYQAQALSAVNFNPSSGGGGGKAVSGNYSDLINSTSQKYGVDPRLVQAVIQQESGGNAGARSGAGAMGLMQLMPGTASSLGVSNPLDPTQNVDGGVRYLSQLIKQFGSVPLGLAAYNAGGGNVMKYGGIPPFAETQNYVKSIMSAYNG
jgi:soluble lytic murein transglycosylase-like protein